MEKYGYVLNISLTPGATMLVGGICLLLATLFTGLGVHLFVNGLWALRG